jgi:ATP diphosphatase
MSTEPRYDLNDLLAVMARLRDPERGCPWDLQQDFASIAPHTLEECYELIDAIERGDHPQLREELGDVLFQVIFYAQLGREQGLFEFGELVHALVLKLVRRHPHVFPSGDLSEGRLDVAATDVQQSWERIKQDERGARQQHGVLDDVPLALPALSRAAKLQRRAARVGFDWQDLRQVLAKLEEERDEIEEAVAAGNRAGIVDEVGDLLFVCVNLARFLDIDPELALRGANRKFERRFRHIEQRLRAAGSSPELASLEEMESLWQEAKALERRPLSESPPAAGSAGDACG